MAIVIKKTGYLEMTSQVKVLCLMSRSPLLYRKWNDYHWSTDFIFICFGMKIHKGVLNQSTSTEFTCSDQDVVGFSAECHHNCCWYVIHQVEYVDRHAGSPQFEFNVCCSGSSLLAHKKSTLCASIFNITIHFVVSLLFNSMSQGK